MASRGPEDVQENTCIVCYKGVDIYSIGRCDHPVCYECSTRMRVLCQQNECPICRQDMPTVIFTVNVRPYSEPKNINVLMDKKFKIVFDSEKVQKAYNDLLAHICPKCEGKFFPNFGQLREHVRRVHQLNYCDLCVENLKILTRERRCYTRQELGIHRRQGDPDDRSHRGHPLCQFCDTRFVDTDELYRHLRRNHLYCHFCDADGYDHYYSTYEFLRDHFRAEHFLCEEGECYDEKFTAVFRTEIDLKAHRASVHGRAIGKAAVKQARTLELEFTLAPRPRASRNTRPPNRDEELDILGAVGGIEDPVFTQLNTNCLEEFPSLSGKTGPSSQSPSTTTHQSKVTATIRSSTRGFTINDENFPALGPEATVSLHVNSERPTSSIVNTKPPNLSIHVNHRPSGFTTRVSSSSNHNHFEENFPALSSSGKSSAPVVSIASTQWSSCKKTEPKVSVVKQKPDNGTKPPSFQSKPFMENDFPSLSSHFSASCSVSQETKPTKISSAVNAQSSDSDAIPIATATRSKKKKKSKNNTNVASNTNPPESKKLVSSGNNSNKNNAEEGEKVKRKAKDSSSSNNKPQNVKTEYMSNGSERLEKGIANENKKSKSTSPKLESSPGASGDKKKSHGKSSASKLELKNDQDFPTLTRPRPPGFSDTVRVPPPGFETPKWEVVRPPPGLQPPKHPPPGLEITKPPPGFTLPNGNLLTQLVDDGYRYVVPSDFVKRNKSLISKVVNAIGNDKSDDFKNLSVAFRGDLVTAQEYFTSCQEIMGTPSFKEIFPELLALLPDIKKQQELWPLYMSSDLKETSKKNRLDCCANCGQVVKSHDLRDHRSSHMLETHFPPILNGSSGLAQLPLSNAWTTN